MNRLLQRSVRVVVILTLLVGPLYAQRVFACSMMNQVMDDCCCDAHIPGKESVSGKENADPDIESALWSSEIRCCEQTVEIRLDEDARQDTRIVKPFQIRSDIDPPDLTVPSYELFPEDRRTTLAVVRPLVPNRYFGGKTYLMTLRLRI